MMKVAGSRNGDYKIKQSIGQGNIYKHVNPVINGADYHQENSGLGADYVDTHYPVDGCRTMDSPVQRQEHQKTEGNA